MIRSVLCVLRDGRTLNMEVESLEEFLEKIRKEADMWEIWCLLLD